jgi:hypothetical protein
MSRRCSASSSLSGIFSPIAGITVQSGGRACLAGRPQRHAEPLRGVHLAPHADQRDLERRHREVEHAGQLVGGAEDVLHRRQTGVEHAIEGEDVDLHGNNDSKDVKNANRAKRWRRLE